MSRIDKLVQQAVKDGFYQQTKDQEAIARVRELADFYEGKDFESNPMGYGQLKSPSNSISYKVAADNIRKALEGEQ